MDNLIKELDLQAQKHISGGFWDVSIQQTPYCENC